MPSLARHRRSVVVSRYWGPVAESRAQTYVTPLEPEWRWSTCGPPYALPAGTYEGQAGTRDTGTIRVVLDGPLTDEQAAVLDREFGPPTIVRTRNTSVVLASARLWWSNLAPFVLPMGLVLALLWMVLRRHRRRSAEPSPTPATS